MLKILLITDVYCRTTVCMEHNSWIKLTCLPELNSINKHKLCI